MSGHKDGPLCMEEALVAAGHRSNGLAADARGGTGAYTEEDIVF